MRTEDGTVGIGGVLGINPVGGAVPLLERTGFGAVAEKNFSKKILVVFRLFTSVVVQPVAKLSIRYVLVGEISSN